MHGEKRTLVNLRKLIDEASVVQKATLRCMARMLGPDRLQKLDETLGRVNGNGEQSMPEDQTLRKPLIPP